MKYAAVGVCSLVAVFLGRYCISGRKHCVRSIGRAANAASSLCSTILLVSAFFVGAAWLLNKSHDDFGLWGVATVLLLLMPFQVWTLRNLDSQFRSIETSNVSDELPMGEPRQILRSLVARIRTQSLSGHTAGINCVGQKVKNARA